MHCKRNSKPYFDLSSIDSYISQLRKEKVDLENQLETEQESITNKLQKQLRHLSEEKECGVCYACPGSRAYFSCDRKLEQRWEEHTKQLMGRISEVQSLHQAEKVALQQQIEAEEDRLTNRLVKTIDSIRAKQFEVRKEVDTCTCFVSKTDHLFGYVTDKDKNILLRRSLDKLRAENYALKMHIRREEERGRHLVAEKVLISSRLEMESERQFNQVRTLPEGPVFRDRAMSEPALMLEVPRVTTLSFTWLFLISLVFPLQ